MTLIDKYPHTGLIETTDRSGCQMLMLVQSTFELFTKLLTFKNERLGALCNTIYGGFLSNREKSYLFLISLTVIGLNLSRDTNWTMVIRAHPPSDLISVV